jgi:Ca2+-binding EF-hand superfamily protein
MATIARKESDSVTRQRSLLQLQNDSGTTHERCLKLVEAFIKNCNGKSLNEMQKDTFIKTFSGTLTEEIFCSRLFDFLIRTPRLERTDASTPNEHLDANTFAKGILRFLEMDQRDRISFIIEIFDTDADGFISASELLPLVKAAFLESELDTSDDQLQLALNAIVDSYHKDHIDEGGLSYSAVRFIMGECLSELAGMFEKPSPSKNEIGKRGNTYMEVPTGVAASNTKAFPKQNKYLKAQCKENKNSNSSCDFVKFMDEQWRFHRPRIVWLFFYFLCNILVFEIKFLNWRLNPKYQPMRNLVGNSICWAKGFAELSSFNTGLIFFPVCRQFVSFLRDRTPFKLWKWVPFNDNIDFHMICGHVIMLAGVGHTIAHLINFSRYSTEPNDELWYASPLNGNMAGPRPTLWDVLKTIPGATGLIMLVIMIVAYPIAVFLRRKYFNLFWYSHMLYLVWTVAFICHGMKHMLQRPHAIWYVLPGLFIYCGERLQRFLCQATCEVKVLHAETYDNSTVLYLQKPPESKFHFMTPGSYATLNISKIAVFEWHPFTISSAPDDKYLRFHIRRSGDWTTKLYDCIHKLEEANKKESYQKKKPFTAFQQLLLSNDVVNDNEDHGDQQLNSIVPPDLKELSFVYIQGPFGAPTNDFFRYDYLVLIGLGIGVTPFASILRYLLMKWQSYRCPNCQTVNHNLARHQFVQFNWLTQEVSYFLSFALR